MVMIPILLAPAVTAPGSSLSSSSSESKGSESGSVQLSQSHGGLPGALGLHIPLSLDSAKSS